MSERTALEIADSLEVEMLSLKNADDAAEMLRSQAAEIDRLKRERTGPLASTAAIGNAGAFDIRLPHSA